MVFRYFCTADANVQNYVSEMEKCRLWKDISAAKNLIAYHANSLIYNVNKNYVES
jgi:hypothetical protein